MQKYNISGMSCAACCARVEKAVLKTEGVTECSVNLLTNSMTVEGTATDDAIITAVVAAGYGACVAGEEKNRKEQKPANNETSALLKRFLVSLGFLALLMYISMGHTMFSFPLPGFLSKNCVNFALAQLLLSAAVMVINQKFFVSGVKGVLSLAPNMDTLVSMGSAAAFGYSTFVTFLMSDAVWSGNMALAHSYKHDLYFESAAMILSLITLGKMLESYSKGKTTNAIKDLMELAPETATLLKDGEEITVSADKVRVGDIAVVRAGGRIPVDGVIVKGAASFDESALTGESLPVDKKEGDPVCVSTVNLSGYVEIRATHIGEDTTLSKIIKMVTDASATKAPISKIADKVSGVFVPCVIVIALVTLAAWLLAGQTFGFAIARAISVLVISCPCALGLATPVAIMVGSGISAKHGVLFKTATALENCGKINIAVFDKTGTVTKGTPSVTDVVAKDDALLPVAYSLELKSEHPLAGAVTKYCKNNNVKTFDITDFETVAGGGICGRINGKPVFGGSLKFVSRFVLPDNDLVLKSETFAKEGKTLLWFVQDKTLLGIIAVADTIKEDSKEAITALHKMGIRTVMLTGDNRDTANAIAKKAGIDEVIAGVLPDGKANEINRLKKEGKTAMVGDGINDAPALTTADIGIAIGAGTDIAIESADVVLVKNRLSDVPAAIKLGRKTLAKICQNLFWAFFYNVIGIPLAAGVFIPLLGLKLNPMFGAAAMSLSSFCVVTNALLLNFAKINKNPKIKEKKKMEKTFKVEGMMCPHCEAHVKTALEKIAGVEKAEASHKEKTVKVTLTAQVSDAEIIAAITESGYKVL